MIKAFAATLITLLPVAAFAQSYWGMATRIQPPRIMTPAEMRAGQFLSAPPPVAQYYAAPQQQAQQMRCVTHYVGNSAITYCR